MTQSDDDALVAIRAEKAIVKLPDADRERVIAGLLETLGHIETERAYDRYGDRALRIRHRDALKAHLAPILKILADDVGAFDAMDWLWRHGDGFAAMAELRAFKNTAQRLLEGAKAFEPDPGRTGRGELQLRTDLMRRAFFQLIGVLESAGVRIGATGGRGGPGSRLLCRLIAYATGSEPDPETVKALVRQRRGAK